MHRKSLRALMVGCAMLCAGAGVAHAQSISVWSRQTDESLSVLKALTDAFTAETGIKVETFNTGVDFEQRLARAAAGRTLPDIVLNDTTAMGQMRQMGILEPIDPAKITGSQDVSQSAWDGAKASDGSLYSVPISAQSFAMFIRKDWREKLGMPVPKTWDDVRKLAEAFTTKDPDGNGKADTFGMAIPGSTTRGYASWFISSFIWQAGGDYVKQVPDGFVPTLNTPQVAQALTYVRGMICDKFAQPGAINATTGDTLPTFRSGQTGIFISGPYHIPQLDAEPGKDVVEVDMMPAGPGGIASLAEGTSAFLLKSSKDHDAANKFFSFLISPKGQEIAMAQGSGRTPIVRLPVNSKVDVNAIRQDPRWMVFKETFDKSSHYMPPIPNWTAVRTLTGEGFNSILAKCDADVPTELEALNKQVAKELSGQDVLSASYQ
ncbi:ABC transporter substrate-binding protein [Agrobacterium rubi]|uniref:Sugar ABC transporter substrate-binding protein n=1 Tax=Agrobacterium rubi TaxID=28099 RepID=A0AAE7RAF0_9HYPH|nr:sugar ABC transporter substrate-binding protein [Agrobacterium rubi]NTE87942.1 sugar ABC transporter substrate-binding protein [Agrobacterium rubi]NTF03709.1 sugar ABC transporter substrate-binding protein [Agrobacterium rubi]NTF38035.1 sugar ABC transporter substrate-binding protein [Agrobacterium rubi]OCJ43558.1 sugar ABC transporter substrate-binding protein [Agrobacterium rubi]QTG02047.1 sugar ABC transporter substrate-binding protein [Agrobacterium rubi]